MNKHQLRTEATKAKLLKAARRIFARDGFEAAKIDEIAALAGFTRGAFYAHFNKKEDLFLALLEQQSSLNVEKLRALAEKCSSEQERLRVVREFYSEQAGDSQWSILVLEFKLYALRHPKLRAKLAEAHRSIRAKIKLEVAQRLLPERMQLSGEPHRLRRVVLEVLRNGLALETAYDPESITRDQVHSVLAELFDFIVETKKL